MNLFQRDVTSVQTPPYLMRRITGEPGPMLRLPMGPTKRSKASYKNAGAKGGNTRMVMSFVKGLWK